MPEPVAVTKFRGGFLSPVRAYPLHGYTPASISRKRFRENTSLIAVTVGFVLPTLTAVNQQLERHVQNGTDVSLREIGDIFATCAQQSAKVYVDRLARAAAQTALTCTLIESKSGVASSMVYLWDLYPRLAQRYVGEIFDLLRIPRFFATLLGPAPLSSDIAYLESRATPTDALVASLQRNTIFLVGDLVIDTAVTLADSNVRGSKKAAVIAKKAVARVTAALCWAGGAALGRAVGGERGEYWGEYFGTVAAGAVTVQVLLLLDNVRSSSGKRKSSHKLSASRWHGSSSSKPPSTATTPAMAYRAK